MLPLELVQATMVDGELRSVTQWKPIGSWLWRAFRWEWQPKQALCKWFGEGGRWKDSCVGQTACPELTSPNLFLGTLPCHHGWRPTAGIYAMNAYWFMCCGLHSVVAGTSSSRYANGSANKVMGITFAFARLPAHRRQAQF